MTVIFSQIIQDFLSREYPDCIKDVFGDNYGFISGEKLLKGWQAIQSSGTEEKVIGLATEWANLMKRAFPQQIAYPQLTKSQLFEQLNLPVLTDAKLVYSENLGPCTINRKGGQLRESNTDDWELISHLTYEIIRILMVEIIWQSREAFNERNIQEMESKNNNELKAKIQNGMTLRLRTRDSLTELLQAGKSGDWLIAKWREERIAKVQIFNWDGSLMLQASFDASKSQRTEEDRLIVGLSGEDARIVKCDPPLKWVGQNPVNYVDDGAVEKRENERQVTAPQLTDEPPPNAPDGWDDFSPQLAEICESVCGEPVRLIYWRVDGEGKQFSTLFRERRRGWYFQMLLIKENGKWSSEHRVLPSFLLLLKPDETAWAKLTKEATTEDWYALDEIFLDTLAFPGSEVLLAGSDLIGEEVADEAMERFGFYVPDEELLPALIFENRRLGMKLVSYFKHPDGFAKENMVQDDKAKQCEVFDSLKETQQRLEQKLFYYTNEA